MKWIAASSGDGRSPAASRTASAAEYFRRHGAIGLANLFPRSFIARLRAEVLKEIYGGRLISTGNCLKVGNKRHIVSLPCANLLATRSIYANPVVMPILKNLLGPDFIIGNIGVVLALPGAESQHVHRDAPPLFPGASTPPYCINLAVPLMDFDASTGTTKIWRGSHLPQPRLVLGRRGESLFIRQGSCYLFDYRILHCGTPNKSRKLRPLLYLTYQRSWFRDKNFASIPWKRLIGASSLAGIPSEWRWLFRANKDKR